MASETKTILITGATDGLGRRVAERLSQPGVTLLVHGRCRERGQHLVAAIREAGGAAIFYRADFASLAEVRGLAQSIMDDHERLDVLINNAGIGMRGRYPGRAESRDGHELRFAINYLGGFLLTRQLLPPLAAGAPARIVNVASAGQHTIDFSDVMLMRAYSGQRAYCQSKLAHVLFTFDLAHELKGRGVTVNALHPSSYMDTAMVRGDGISPMTDVDQGADAILHLALAPEMADRTGLYFDGMKPSRASPQAYDPAARAQLRALSFAWTGLSPANV
jgi:NAD(P)-dependent dehydrogenase (short-subunit alcohol dehydrogenase family)